jgi:hypothetical protein
VLTTAHWVYVTPYENGPVHLVPFLPVARYRSTVPVTLCGQRTGLWSELDETTSGIAATCNACRHVAGLPLTYRS